MEQAMTRIWGWLQSNLAQRKQQRKARKEERLQREAEHRIQVREFDGVLCLCLDNIPVLERTAFNDAELKQARFLLFNYLKRVR
jgi:hypothetical protein